jgi:hypothetical protein
LCHKKSNSLVAERERERERERKREKERERVRVRDAMHSFSILLRVGSAGTITLYFLLGNKITKILIYMFFCEQNQCKTENAGKKGKHRDKGT